MRGGATIKKWAAFSFLFLFVLQTLFPGSRSRTYSTQLRDIRKQVVQSSGNQIKSPDGSIISLVPYM